MKDMASASFTERRRQVDGKRQTGKINIEMKEVVD